MKFAAKTLTAVSFLSAIISPASAGTMEEQSAGQAASFGSLALREGAAVPAPGPAHPVSRDVFGEVEACSVLDAHFFIQPRMKDALNMLKPCLAGVSALTGDARISANSANNGAAIEIVVFGSRNRYVKQLLTVSLSRRNDRIFGYPASVVLAAGEREHSLSRDIFREAGACAILNAQFFMQPRMQEALNMLKPCLDDVSRLTGNAPLAAKPVKNSTAIEITVLDGKSHDVKDLLRGSLSKRHNQLFGYPATVVINDASLN